MAIEQKIQDYRIDQFHAGPGARADHWRFLMDAANAWSDGSGKRDQFDALMEIARAGGPDVTRIPARV